MSLKNPVTPPGIDPGTVRLVTQCLNHYATPVPICGASTNKIHTNIKTLIHIPNDLLHAVYHAVHIAKRYFGWLVIT